MGNKRLLFADYDEDKAFDGILAIEPELGRDYFFEHNIAKEGDMPCQSNRTGKLKPEYQFEYEFKGKPKKGLRGHNESSMIFELDNIHEIPLEKRKELLAQFQKDYQGYFTLGASTKASGGVHFHVFSQLHKSVSLPIMQGIDINNINTNLYNTLLFGVINDKKFYSRAVYAHRNFNKNELIPQGNRNHIACTKMDFLPGIEYRANNVFDIRLYGYYVAITILGITNTELPSPTKNTSLRGKITKGCQECYTKKDIDEFGRLHVSKMKPLIDMKKTVDFSMAIFKQNIGKMLFVLSINDLPDAREALEEYIEEVMGLEINAVPFDFTTNKITKARDGYTMEVGGVVSFFRDKKAVRKILLSYGSNLFATMIEGSLSSVTSTIKKVNLISKEDL